MEQLEIFRPENKTTLVTSPLPEKAQAALLLAMSQLLLALVHPHDEDNKGDDVDE